MSKFSLIIPVYNHPNKIKTLCQHVLSFSEISNLIVVNDGSDRFCTDLLKELALELPIRLIEHQKNLGKGAAVISGLRESFSLGCTHAIQVDADGQHDILAIPDLIRVSQINPKDFIVGAPLYDSSVPKGRLIGRYATHIWVWINTLSFSIKDSMCGFRVYVIEPTLKIADHVSMGKRMDFDTEILVRLSWQGFKFVNFPVKVVYPRDGISHFKLIRDNCLISWMHAKLFFGMLIRLPAILFNKAKRW